MLSLAWVGHGHFICELTTVMVTCIRPTQDQVRQRSRMDEAPPLARELLAFMAVGREGTITAWLSLLSQHGYHDSFSRTLTLTLQGQTETVVFKILFPQVIIVSKLLELPKI